MQVRGDPESQLPFDQLTESSKENQDLNSSVPQIRIMTEEKLLHALLSKQKTASVLINLNSEMQVRGDSERQLSPGHLMNSSRKDKAVNLPISPRSTETYSLQHCSLLSREKQISGLIELETQGREDNEEPLSLTVGCRYSDSQLSSEHPINLSTKKEDLNPSVSQMTTLAEGKRLYACSLLSKEKTYVPIDQDSERREYGESESQLSLNLPRNSFKDKLNHSVSRRELFQLMWTENASEDVLLGYTLGSLMLGRAPRHVQIYAKQQIQNFFLECKSLWKQCKRTDFFVRKHAAWLNFRICANELVEAANQKNKCNLLVRDSNSQSIKVVSSDVLLPETNRFHENTDNHLESLKQASKDSNPQMSNEIMETVNQQNKRNLIIPLINSQPAKVINESPDILLPETNRFCGNTDDHLESLKRASIDSNPQMSNEIVETANQHTYDHSEKFEQASKDSNPKISRRQLYKFCQEKNANSKMLTEHVLQVLQLQTALRHVRKYVYKKMKHFLHSFKVRWEKSNNDGNFLKDHAAWLESTLNSAVLVAAADRQIEVDKVEEKTQLSVTDLPSTDRDTNQQLPLQEKNELSRSVQIAEDSESSIQAAKESDVTVSRRELYVCFCDGAASPELLTDYVLSVFKISDSPASSRVYKHVCAKMKTFISNCKLRLKKVSRNKNNFLKKNAAWLDWKMQAADVLPTACKQVTNTNLQHSQQLPTRNSESLNAHNSAQFLRESSETNGSKLVNNNLESLAQTTRDSNLMISRRQLYEFVHCKRANSKMLTLHVLEALKLEGAPKHVHKYVQQKMMRFMCNYMLRWKKSKHNDTFLRDHATWLEFKIYAAEIVTTANRQIREGNLPPSVSNLQSTDTNTSAQMCLQRATVVSENVHESTTQTVKETDLTISRRQLYEFICNGEAKAKTLTEKVLAFFKLDDVPSHVLRHVSFRMSNFIGLYKIRLNKCRKNRKSFLTRYATWLDLKMNFDELLPIVEKEICNTNIPNTLLPADKSPSTSVDNNSELLPREATELRKGDKLESLPQASKDASPMISRKQLYEFVQQQNANSKMLAQHVLKVLDLETAPEHVQKYVIRQMTIFVSRYKSLRRKTKREDQFLKKNAAWLDFKISAAKLVSKAEQKINNLQNNKVHEQPSVQGDNTLSTNIVCNSPELLVQEKNVSNERTQLEEDTTGLSDASKDSNLTITRLDLYRLIYKKVPDPTKLTHHVLTTLKLSKAPEHVQKHVKKMMNTFIFQYKRRWAKSKKHAHFLTKNAEWLACKITVSKLVAMAADLQIKEDSSSLPTLLPTEDAQSTSIKKTEQKLHIQNENDCNGCAQLKKNAEILAQTFRDCDQKVSRRDLYEYLFHRKINSKVLTKHVLSVLELEAAPPYIQKHVGKEMVSFISEYKLRRKYSKNREQFLKANAVWLDFHINANDLIVSTIPRCGKTSHQ